MNHIRATQDVRKVSEANFSGEIFIVDDDAAVRDALSVVFTLEGYPVRGFIEGASLLAATRSHTPACIILDALLPGQSGLDILKELDAHDYTAPIIIISGQGDIPMAVDALKKGAHDFIEKPFEADTVLACVCEAIETRARRGKNGRASGIQSLHFPTRELLTAREHEVLAQITAGASNKESGIRLGISPRTVEVHRAHIMEKLGARNTADLVRIVLSQGNGR